MMPVLISVLLEAALRALVVALAVGTGLRLLRVRNVLAQKVAWGLVLAASLAMPVVMRWPWLPASAQIRLTTPAWLRRAWLQAANSSFAETGASSSANTAVAFNEKEAAPAASTRLQSSAVQEPEPVGGNRYPAPAISSGDYGAPLPVRAAQAVPSTDMRGKLAGVGIALRPIQPGMFAALAYVAVCVLLLLRLLYGVGAAAKMWLAAEPVARDMSANIAPGLPLRSSEAVFSPVTIGSGVVLPADYAEWDSEKLRIVLAHERSHIRQGDFYLQMLAGLYAAVFWFSPLGWWLKRKLSDLGEAISDRAGLEEAASRASYAQVLLEFAAMPRPTLTGVAMARTTNLSHRIERLLNDSIFRQSFAASRRALLVGLLFPLALIAATSMVRVEAAGQAHPTAPPPPPAQAPAPAPPMPQAPLTGVSNPDQAPPAFPAPAPAAMPAPPASPDVAPAPAPAPPMPPTGPYGEIHDQADDQDTTVTNTNTIDKNGHSHSTSVGHGYSYLYSSNGDAWALVTSLDQPHVSLNGDWNEATRASFDKATMAHGKFIWFTRKGKSYIVDDPALVAQVEVIYKPMRELGRQQEELGRQQEKLGQEQEQLARQQSQARVPTPDMTREIAQAASAIAKLKAEKDAQVSQQELAEIQGKLAELQGRLGEIQGRIGDARGVVGEKQGHLGELQGNLGEQQGRLGEQQGKLAEEANRKVKAMIDQSLSNGKAKPVE